MDADHPPSPRMPGIGHRDIAKRGDTVGVLPSSSTICAAATPRSAIFHRWSLSDGVTTTAADPDAPEPAAVLAAVKDKPFGRPQEAAVLDRRSARRPHQCAGRDGRMAPPGAELKNASTQEGNMPSHQ